MASRAEAAAHAVPSGRAGAASARPRCAGRQPGLHEARAVGEELLVREDPAGAGRQGAPARDLVIVLRDGDDRQARLADARDGRHGIEPPGRHVHDGAAQRWLVAERLGLERDGQLRVAGERARLGRRRARSASAMRVDHMRSSARTTTAGLR